MSGRKKIHRAEAFVGHGSSSERCWRMFPLFVSFGLVRLVKAFGATSCTNTGFGSWHFWKPSLLFGNRCIAHFCCYSQCWSNLPSDWLLVTSVAKRQNGAMPSWLVRGLMNRSRTPVRQVQMMEALILYEKHVCVICKFELANLIEPLSAGKGTTIVHGNYTTSRAPDSNVRHNLHVSHF